MALTINEIQSLITNKHDLREVINEMADYLQANPVGSSSYLVYTALLQQTGTNAPVATVLQNTLGGTVVWSRDSLGTYFATLTGAFTSFKTIMPPFGGSGVDVMGIYNATPFDYSYTMQPGINENYVVLNCLNNTGAPAELSTAALGKIFIEIRVYL